MITRRTFTGLCSLSLVFLPVWGCVTDEDETDVTWFLSETEIMAVGKAYAQKSFSFIDNDTLVAGGWVITLAEAEVCKKKYLKSA